MKIGLFILLSIFINANIADAERSYLMIPDAVQQAENISKAADNLGREYSSQAPRTAPEAMHRLHQMDDDLERVVLLAKRFQQTNRLLEQGIQDTGKFAQQNAALIVEWQPVLRGNYQLMHAVFENNKPDNMRVIVAMNILEQIINSMAMREASTHKAMNLQLQFSKEASVIHAARQRLYLHLTQIRDGLNIIRNTARSRM